MNERIRELFSKSCWDEQAEVDIEDFISVEKFARLIVLECANAIRSDSLNFPSGDLTWIAAMQESARVVTKHFGVKESQ